MVQRILVVAPFDDNWNWLSHHFETTEYSWTFLRGDLLGSGRKALIMHAWRAVRAARSHDAIITHGPWLALFTATFMRLSWMRRPHLAFTFNHGNGIFFSGLFRILAWIVLPSVRAFITHSNYERELFSKIYRIPLNRMVFAYWAVGAPTRNLDEVHYIKHGDQFVCCIGRNNRDLYTFVEAIRKTRVNGILICRAGQADGIDLPANLVLRTDVPMSECDEVIEKATASIVPLIDESTGTGHMTIVTSLHYGTPVIATRSAVLTDYVKHERTGLLVKRGSTEDLAAAIERLTNDSTLQKRLHKSCLNFARQHLTEECAAAFLREMLKEHVSTNAEQKVRTTSSN